MIVTKQETTNEILGALALDLKRVALGYHNGSEQTAKRFSEEALKRKAEVGDTSVKLYIRRFLNALPEMLSQKDKQKLTEDALMYSTIFQNYVLKNG